MSTSPLVSIVVPVYNSEEYLPELFSSIRAQTMTDYEVLFVDDGSEDASLSLLKNFQKEDHRVKVCHQENEGGASARNKGLDMATGELVICIDSDDIVGPSMLESMSAPFCDADVGMVVSYIDTYFEDTGEYRPMPWAVSTSLPVNRSFPPASENDIFRDIIGYIGNKMIRRSLIENHGLRFQQIRSHDDLSFVYSAMAASTKIEIIDQALYHYRRRSDGTSVTDTTMVDLYECAFFALEDLKNNLVAYGNWQEFEQIFVNYALYMCKWKVSIAPKEKALEIRNNLRDYWFRSLDLLGFPRGFYLHDDEYTFMCNCLNYEYVQSLREKIRKLKTRIKKLQATNESIKASPSYKIGRKITALPRALKRSAKF